MKSNSNEQNAEFSSDYIKALLQTPFHLLSSEEKRVIRAFERSSLAYERFLRKLGLAYQNQLTPTEVRVLRRARRRNLQHQRVVNEMQRSRFEPSPQQLHKSPQFRDHEDPTYPLKLMWSDGYTEVCSYQRFMRDYWPKILQRYKIQQSQNRKTSKRKSRIRENAYELFKKKFSGR